MTAAIQPAGAGSRRIRMLTRAVLGLVLGVSAVSLAAQAPVKTPPSADRSRVFVAADAPEIADGTAAVSGRVIDANTRQPIEGARVQIAAPSHKPRAMFTDSAGRFAFAHLPAGAFVVVADRAGYMSAGNGQLRPDGSTLAVNVSAGEERRDVSITLWQFAAMSGHVLDPNLKPVSNVPVYALTRASISGRDRLVIAKTTTTAADGAFEFTELQPATYIVAALVGVPQYYASGPLAGAAVPIELTSGLTRAGVDFVAGPIDVFAVSGTLAGPDGPAANVSVVLDPDASDILKSPVTEKRARTDASGAFAFSGVPPGDYMIRAGRTPDTNDPAAPKRSLLPAPGQALEFAEAPVAVGNKDVAGIELMLRPSPRVSGSVRFNGSRPLPPPADIQGLQIYLEPADGVPAPYASLGQPDAALKFLTSAVPPGRYVLRLGNTRALTGWTFKSAMVDDRDISDDAVALSSDLKDVVITFTDRPAQLTGNVAIPAGAASAQAAVIVFPVDRAHWFDGGLYSRRRLRVRTNASGNYSIVGLPPGEYFVAAVSEEEVGEWNDAATFDALAKIAKRVTITDGGSASQSLVVSRLVVR